MFERQSALVGALMSGGCDGADGQRRLRIGEVRGKSVLQTAAFPTRLSEIAAIVRTILDAELPREVGEVVNSGSGYILKTGAAQYWIIAPENDDRPRVLQGAVDPTIGAVTPLSHSRTFIFIQGSKARAVLAQGIALDLHPDAFRVGQFALTGLHHTPILIHRSTADTFELVVMRTFAQWLWEWITDAARALGYEILGPLSNENHLM